MLTPEEAEFHVRLYATVKNIRNIGALKEALRSELKMLDRAHERAEDDPERADYVEGCKRDVARWIESLEQFSDDEDILLAPWEIEDPEVLRRAYEKTGNPLYVWQAIAFDIGYARELPLWVRGYLVNSGMDLLKVAFGVVLEDAKIKNPASEVAKALRFQRGGGNYFSEYADTKAHWMFLGEQVEKLVDQGDKPYIAWECVAARYKVSSATVRRAWLRFQAVFEGQ